MGYEFSPGRLRELEVAAQESLEAAEALVAAEDQPFEDFLAAFLAFGTEDESGARRQIL